MMPPIDNFYDENESRFNTNSDIKIAQVLGEDIDNPKSTFKIVEDIFDGRIKKLNEECNKTKKTADSFIEANKGINEDINSKFDKIVTDFFEKIKKLVEDFDKNKEDLNDQNLMLQKKLTQLTKEKMELNNKIKISMNKLDEIEKYLGINIENKKTKKNFK